MKAAVLKETGHLDIEEMVVPRCQDGEVLVKVGACAICKTDTKMYHFGHRDLRLPRVLGHEIAGIVAHVGKGITGFQPGDRVQVAPGIPCGNCLFCLKGICNMCESMSIIGFHCDGGFAEYIVVPASGVRNACLTRIPDRLSLEEAALAEPIACCINAQELCKVEPGDVVVVFGAGPIGHLHTQVSRLLGAAQVILVERDPRRIAFAESSSVDIVLDSTKSDPIEGVLNRTEGKGANVVLCSCSAPDVPLQGINMLAKRGRISFFSGLPHGHENICLNHNLIHYKEIQIFGAYGCTSEQNSKAITMLARGGIKVDWLITHRISLDGIADGFKLVDDHTAMEVVVTEF